MSSWPDAYFGVTVIDGATEDEMPRRAKIRFAGCTVADNPGNDRTDITYDRLESPVFTGSPRYAATRGNIRSVVGEVQTSSTSQVTAASYTMADESLCAFDVIVTCARRTSVTKGGRYKRSVVYRRTGGGAPTIVGSIELGVDQETTAGDNATIDVSGNAVRVRVTAADADDRNWLAEMRVQETFAT
jgi:hypothetical protein